VGDRNAGLCCRLRSLACSGDHGGTRHHGGDLGRQHAPSTELPRAASPATGSIPDIRDIFPLEAVSDAEANPAEVSQEALLASVRASSKESEADSGARPWRVPVLAPHPLAPSPTNQKRGRPCWDGRGVPAPSIRLDGVRASGSLSRDDIERVVRQNFGRFRLCYEANGMRTQPSLHGRVTVKFEVSANGAVSLLIDDRSDLPDPSTVTCIVRNVGILTFPSADAGSMAAFSLTFSPSPPLPPCPGNSEPSEARVEGSCPARQPKSETPCPNVSEYCHYHGVVVCVCTAVCDVPLRAGEFSPPACWHCFSYLR